MINETAVEVARATVYNYSLIYLWLGFFILIPAITLLTKSKKANMGKFWGNWLAIMTVTGILTIFLSLYPDKIIKFTDTIRGFFGYVPLA